MPLSDEVEQAIMQGKSFIEIKPGKRSISNTILAQPFRNYFINKVKAPLMKAIIEMAKRFPEPTKENTSQPNTHILLDIRDHFF